MTLFNTGKMHGSYTQVGSTGEGISKYTESDTDVIFLTSNILCVEDSSSAKLVSEQTTVFAIRNTNPGYCQLELLSQGTINYDEIVDSLVPYNGSQYLSSEILSKSLEMQVPGCRNSTTGPAMTASLDYELSVDHVYSLPTDCHDILQKWLTRPRKYDWPPVNIRQAIHNMKGNLVATGMKNSETKHLEWRFCFNELELLLVDSLNDTQIKLYKMLKIVNTDILKPCSYNVSSYIIKNIVFWLAETYPESMFQPKDLFSWVLKGLLLLKRAMRLNYIPYYMIPGRNLLKEKIRSMERKPLYDKLSFLVRSGPEILYQCKAICDTMRMIPRELALFQEKNNELEMLYLLRRKRLAMFLLQNVSFESMIQ